MKKPLVSDRVVTLALSAPGVAGCPPRRPWTAALCPHECAEQSSPGSRPPCWRKAIEEKTKGCGQGAGVSGIPARDPPGAGGGSEFWHRPDPPQHDGRHRLCSTSRLGPWTHPLYVQGCGSPDGGWQNPNSPVMKKLGEGLLKARGVRVFYTFYFGTRQLTADRQVLNPKDLQGVKIRAIPFPIYMAAVEGMAPQRRQSTGRGTLSPGDEGGERPGESGGHHLLGQLYETQSHLMLTSHIMGGGAGRLSMMPAWKKLSPTLQGQMMEAASEVSKKATQMMRDSDASYTKQLADKGHEGHRPQGGVGYSGLPHPASRSSFPSVSTPSSGRGVQRDPRHPVAGLLAKSGVSPAGGTGALPGSTRADGEVLADARRPPGET